MSVRTAPARRLPASVRVPGARVLEALQARRRGVDAGAAHCTCCEEPVDDLVTAPRRDGSPRPVCARCRDLIVEGKGWDEVRASVRLAPTRCGPESAEPRN